MPETKQAPLPKPWTCFCHKHGGFFHSTSAVDIVCVPCTSGRKNGSDWLSDFFNNPFTNSTTK